MSFKTSVNLLSGECFPVGCRICAGQLLPAPVYKKLIGSVPTGVLLAEYPKGVERFLLCTDDEIYASTGGGNDFLSITTLAGNSPFMLEDIVDGKARALVISGGHAVYYSGGRFNVIYNYGANLSCGVMHCGRVFGADSADGLKLRWSGEGGITDWKEGPYGSGSLTLDPERGVILNILQFGEKLVAVRKFGLTVLSMFGSPENFSVEITDTDTDEIYKGTARVVGATLIFCTASGLHTFDGSRIKKLTHRFAGDISNPVCSAEHKGIYYLGCNSKILKGGAVLCYNSADGESWLTDLPADGICAAEKIYVYNSSGAFILEDGLAYAFTSGEINFGSGRYKTATGIFIDCERADVEISNGKTVRKFNGVSGLIRPKLRGKSFTIKVAGSAPVRALTATAEECNAI